MVGAGSPCCPPICMERIGGGADRRARANGGRNEGGMCLASVITNLGMTLIQTRLKIPPPGLYAPFSLPPFASPSFPLFAFPLVRCTITRPPPLCARSGGTARTVHHSPLLFIHGQSPPLGLCHPHPQFTRPTLPTCPPPLCAHGESVARTMCHPPLLSIRRQSPPPGLHHPPPSDYAPHVPTHPPPFCSRTVPSTWVAPPPTPGLRALPRPHACHPFACMQEVQGGVTSR